MKKIYLLLLFALAFAQLNKGQGCTTKTDKIITDANPYSVPCVNFTARDNITLLPGFSFSSIYNGQPQIVELTWKYFSLGTGKSPYLTINSITSSGKPLPIFNSVGKFRESISDLAFKLKTALGANWNVNMQAPNGNLATIRVENFSAFSYNGSNNYNNATVLQGYMPIGSSATFNAKIDENMVFNMNYIPTSSVPDADNRTLDKTLVVGSIAGGAGVSPSGAASYNVPIMVPGGLGNMVPQLSIAYNSQGGNGLLGWGWNLSGLSAISRAPQTIYSDGSAKGVQIVTDDRYALDGNKLIAIGKFAIEEYGGDNMTYITELETFSNIISHGTYNGPEWFEVNDKNGNKYKYGGTATGDGGRVMYKSGTTNAVVAWYIDYAEDLLGNYIKYTYEQDGLSKYLKKISYGCNKNNDTQNYYTVEFFYEKRTDVIPVHYGNLNGSMNRVLHRILVKNGNSIFRNYNFEYSNKDNSDPFSRLVKIMESDGNGKQYNPTLVKWGDYNSATITVTPTISGELYMISPYMNTFSSILTGDYTGDGVDDAIINSYYLTKDPKNVNKPASIRHSMVTFFENTNRDITGFNYNYNKKNPNAFELYQDEYKEKAGFSDVVFGDVNGDGKFETIAPYFDWDPNTTNKAAFYYVPPYPSYEGVGSARRPNLIGSSINLRTKGKPSFAIADIDNDGYAEIIVLENNYMSIVGGYPGYIYYRSLDKWVNFNFLTPAPAITYNLKPFMIIPTDFNGDGTMDLIINGDVGPKLLINKGTGISEFQDAGFIGGFTSNYTILPGDFNGDGLPDFVYCAKNSTTWKLALNNGNNGLTETILSNITQSINESQYYWDTPPQRDRVIVTDFNNDGKSDIVMFYAANGVGYAKWFKSTGNGFTEQYSNSNFGYYMSYLIYGDFNGDGRAEIFQKGTNAIDGNDSIFKWRLYSTPNLNNSSGLVSTVANGINHKTQFMYKPLTDNSIYSKNMTAYPLVTIQQPLYVVSEVKSDNGILDTNNKYGQSSITYAYANALVHLQGKGFLGFASTTQTDNTSKIQTVSSFALADIETTCFTLKKQTTVVSSTATSPATDISKTVNTFDYNLFWGKHIFYHPVATASTDFLRNITVTKTNTYDGSAAVPYDGNGNLTSEDVAYGSDRANYVTTNYSSFVQNKPQLVETTKKHADDAAAYTSKVRFSYDATKGYVLTKTGYEELTVGKKIVTTYTHDPNFGYVTNELVTFPDKNYDAANKTFLPDVQKTLSTSYAYTADGRFLKTKTESLGMVSEFEYDGIGNLMSEKSPAGFITKYEYNNPFYRLSKTINPDGTWAAVSTSWTGSNPPSNAAYCNTASATASAPATKYYDILGRELRTETTNFIPKTIFTDVSYNAKGQTEWQTLPYFIGETPVKKFITHDDYGRTKSQYFDANEQTVTNGYTASSTKVTTTYAGTGRFLEKTSDVWGNLKLTTDAKGNTVTYSYLSRGVPATITAAGIATTMQYDEYGNQIELRDPSSAGKRNYVYNSVGKLYQQTDEKGSKTNSVFDDLGRLTTQYIGADNVNYTYDTKIKGLLSSVIHSNGTSTEYFYDPGTGRITSRNEVINAKTFTTGYEYDGNGDLLKTTYPSGFKTANVYDGNGNLTQIKTDAGVAIWKATDANAAGQVNAYTLGEAKHNVTKIFDKYGTVTNITTPGVLELEYVYFDDTRNLKTRKNKTKTLNETFTYDELDRLKTWGTTGQYSIDYSGVKIDKKYDAATGNYVYLNGTYKVSSLPGAIMEMRKPENISYNDMNKISHIDEYNQGATIGYSMDITYDNAQSRKMVVLKKDNSTTVLTRYYVGGIYEQEERGTSVRQIDYIKGASAIHVKNGGLDTIYYLHTDNQGSWLAVTNNKDAIVKEQAFDPWGRRRNPADWTLNNTTNGFPFARGYTGHEHMDMFGLINMNGRVYDAVLGMFLSPDNYVQAPDMPQNFNRYSYCLNNPLIYTDPSGDFWQLLLQGAFLGGMQAGLSGGDFFKGALIGGLTAGFSSFFPQGIGFLPGAIGGATLGGITGGFVNATSGGSFKDGFISGALGGGIMGGIIGYSRAVKFGIQDPLLGNGNGNPIHELATNSDRITGNFTDEDINSYAKANGFNNQYGVEKISITETPNNIPTLGLRYSRDLNGVMSYTENGGKPVGINGLMVPKYKWGIYHSGNIYLSQQNSLRAIIKTLNHELIHAYHYSSNFMIKYQIGERNLRDWSESIAYDYTNSFLPIEKQLGANAPFIYSGLLPVMPQPWPDFLLPLPSPKFY